MSHILFANNAKSFLASEIGLTTTTLELEPGDGVLFPEPGEGQLFKVTVLRASGQLEIMHCTERINDNLTVVRAQEGTEPRIFEAGDRVQCRVTRNSLQAMVQHDQFVEEGNTRWLQGESGTTALFRQTTAPTGWQKVVSGVNNRAIRITDGIAGQGGNVAFTNVFGTYSHNHGGTNNHTLSVSRIPSHSHAYTRVTAQAFANPIGSGDGGFFETVNTGSTGGGNAHSHGISTYTMDLRVRYLDMIVATKN